MTAAAAFYRAIDGTWPAAAMTRVGPWMIRDGQDGGKRVSAATADAPLGDLAQAEEAMRDAHQTPLFMVRQGEDALDRQLDQAGYTIVAPTTGYIAPVDTLTAIPIPRVTAFAIWEPLAIMEDIWAKGGIGPARLAIMHRAKTKTAILARHSDKPAGTAFAAIHERLAMVHAVEVLPHQRRQGMAQWMMRRAAFWAAEQGATHIAVLTTAANGPANALYQGLGFQQICGYHYRTAIQTT